MFSYTLDRVTVVCAVEFVGEVVPVATAASVIEGPALAERTVIRVASLHVGTRSRVHLQETEF